MVDPTYTLFHLDLASTVSKSFDLSLSFSTLLYLDPAARDHARGTRAPPLSAINKGTLDIPKPLTLLSGSASETRRSRTYTILKGRSRTQTTALRIPGQ